MEFTFNSYNIILYTYIYIDIYAVSVCPIGGCETNIKYFVGMVGVWSGDIENFESFVKAKMIFKFN